MVPMLESGARLLVTKFLQRFITAGCITLLEEGSTTLTFGVTTKGCNLKVTLRVHTPQFYWKVAMEGDLGFADAYINGDVSFVDKDEGLLNFFLIIMSNTELSSYASKLNKKRGWWTPMFYTSILSSAKYFFKFVFSKNSLSRARRNIAEHYDLSNELFSLYLDDTMTYSCAVFKVPEYPTKLFFFCEVEPAIGGETPVVLSHVVYERMKDKCPDFVDKLEKHGVIYTRVLGEEDDPLSPIGRGWKSTFLTTHKSVAEERAAKLNMKLEWTNDGVKSIMGPIPAIKYDESRQRKIWLNSMVAAYTGWDDKRNDPKKAVTFGDGSPLPEHIIHDCLKILEEESIAIPWKKGDVLLIDNLAVLHSRKPFTPPRRILASQCK